MHIESGNSGMLEEVRQAVRSSLNGTSLRDYAAHLESVAGGGKMLRTRLMMCLGASSAVDEGVLCRAAAAVEMLHAASLLHDDILDGGTLRRGEPALWVSDGTKAAVIMGDLLVSLAVQSVQEALPDHLPELIQTLRDMCDAEAEQEFSKAAEGVSWAKCTGIARRKTGSLFGFAAGCAGGGDAGLVLALRKAGCQLGTAYQLADDLLDVCMDPFVSDKSLGTDALLGRLTAASASPPDGMTHADAVRELLDGAELGLEPWPAIQNAWRTYVFEVMVPLIERYAAFEALEGVA